MGETMSSRPPRGTPTTEQLEEDAADIFDTALSALFALPPIGYSTSSPSQAHIYTPPLGEPVRLWLPHPPASVYAALQANNLWLSAVFLADALATGRIELELASSASPGRAVLELGAGHGLPSIMAARCGARVVCTDYDDAVVVGTIKRNFEAAFPSPSPPSPSHRSSTSIPASSFKTPSASMPSPSRSSSLSAPAAFVEHGWAALGHTWGTDPAPLLALAPGYDIIMADTIWSTDKHGVLLDSVCATLRRPPPQGGEERERSGRERDGEAEEGKTLGGDAGGIVHLAAGLHTGRGPLQRFLALAKARGLEAHFEDEVQWQSGGTWGRHEYAGGEVEEERGVVVYYTLRWAS